MEWMTGEWDFIILDAKRLDGGFSSMTRVGGRSPSNDDVVDTAGHLFDRCG